MNHLRKQHDLFYDRTSWKNLSSKALRRDGYQCQISKRYKAIPDQAQCVHHIFPREFFPEYELCLWNLISLSFTNHGKMHDRKTGGLTEEGKKLMYKTAIKNKIDYQAAIDRMNQMIQRK